MIFLHSSIVSSVSPFLSHATFYVCIGTVALKRRSIQGVKEKQENNHLINYRQTSDKNIPNKFAGYTIRTFLKTIKFTFTVYFYSL
jgi:hypothetical protein